MTTALPVVPARVHCEKQQETVAVTAHNVHTHGRKHSFRGFSTHSLSSLTLAHTKPHTTAAIIGHTGAHPKRSLFSFGGGSGNSTQGVAVAGVPAGSSIVRCADKETNASRPPSLITDDSSLASISSRSPSPEPTQQAPTPAQQSSRLEAAFKRYAHSFNVQILHTQLLPVLARSGPAATNPVLVLHEADVAFLFKWWHHLLLLSPPHPTVFVCVWALASHPTLLKSAIWNAHYALTLSTLLAQDANVLPTGPFVRLLALGYLLHPPTQAILRARFTAKASTRRTSSLVEVQEEVWCQRARQVEVFSELLRQIYQQRTNYEDEDGVLSSRLEQIMTKLLAVRTATPNTRLLNCGRILGQAEGRLAVLVESRLQAVASCTRAFDPAAVFHLLDLLSLLRIKQVAFWTTVLERILDTENHILQIRVFAYLYEHWPLYEYHAPACALLLSPPRWQHYFVHWSGIVRDHYMRLLCYRLSASHPQRVRMLLKRTFITSLGEHCQLRDCLPGNPIPNKKFAIRPCGSMQQQQQQQKWLATGATPLALFAQHDTNATTAGRLGSGSSLPGALPPSPPQQHPSPPAQGLEMSAASFVKRKLGLFRGLWEDATPPSPPAARTPLTASRVQLEEEEVEEGEEEEAKSDMAVLGGLARTTSTRSVSSQRPNRPSPTRPQQVQPQRYRFVAEFVGKQWSLTGDADAIRFLDGVMDLAQNGRLPSFVEQPAASEAEERMEEVTEDAAFALGEGRKRLWTRSLSEWSVLLDDQERFWRSQQMLPGHTSSTPVNACGASPAVLVVPRLEVEFPRWFCQKTTTLRGDGIEPQLKR